MGWEKLVGFWVWGGWMDEWMGGWVHERGLHDDCVSC